MDLATARVAPTQEVPGLAAVGVHLQRLDQELDCFGLPAGAVAQLFTAVLEPACNREAGRKFSGLWPSGDLCRVMRVHEMVDYQPVNLKLLDSIVK